MMTGRDLEELFVVRGHRRSGGGTRVRAARPGPASGRVAGQGLSRHRPAIPLWRTAIGEYTDGDFNEHDRLGADAREWSYFTFGNGGGAD